MSLSRLASAGRSCSLCSRALLGRSQIACHVVWLSQIDYVRRGSSRFDLHVSSWQTSAAITWLLLRKGNPLNRQLKSLLWNWILKQSSSEIRPNRYVFRIRFVFITLFFLLLGFQILNSFATQVRFGKPEFFHRNTNNSILRPDMHSLAFVAPFAVFSTLAAVTWVHMIYMTLLLFNAFEMNISALFLFLLHFISSNLLNVVLLDLLWH